jgi:hypothetical protein
MAIHMSIRLAWHSDGWNGHICKKPCAKYPCKTACGLNANAFGKESIQVKVDPPSWWKEGDVFSLM